MSNDELSEAQMHKHTMNPPKTHVDIIVLVIASLSELYTPMIDQYWKRMIDVCEELYSNMKIYLVFGEDPGTAVAIPSGSMIISNTPESSAPGVLLKTIYAYDYIANNQLDLAYDQGAMPAFRRRMAARIIAGTLDAEEARQPGAPLRSECL